MLPHARRVRFLVPAILLMALTELVAASVWLPDSSDRGERFAVVVNKLNPVEDLSFSDIRDLFLVQRNRWPDGRRVTLVLREPGQLERDITLKVIYRMTEQEFARHFLHLRFTGEVQATPRLLATPVGVRRFIYNVPGAIGVVRVTDVDSSVKALRIDGRVPGDPRYPLTLR